MDIERLHATCVAIGSKGVLLTGESGLGKSDLALRLIDRGAALVADDQVEIRRRGKELAVTAPAAIKGLLEVRGLGIFKVKAKEKTNISLVVRLCRPEWIERLPFPEPYSLLGLELPQIRLNAFEHSAPVKIEMALSAIGDGSMTVGALRE